MKKGREVHFVTSHNSNADSFNIVYRLQNKNSSVLLYNHYDSRINPSHDAKISTHNIKFKKNNLTRKSSSQSSDLAYNFENEKRVITANINQTRILCQTQLEDVSQPLTEFPSKINIASWNVRGCSKENKLIEIDNALYVDNIQLAFLQETKLTPGKANTDNFIWHIVGDDSQPISYRGVSILISKKFSLTIFHIEKISSNIMALKFKINSEHVLYI